MSLAEIWAMFRLPMIYVPLIAAMALAVAGSYLGVYIVLKRIVFVGAAMAQLTAAGVALGSLISGTTLASIGFVPRLLGSAEVMPIRVAGLVTAGGVIIFSQGSKSRRLSSESIIGAVYLAAFAAIYLFSAKSAQGLEQVEHLLTGDVLTITSNQIGWIAGISAGVCVLLLLASRQLAAISFDPETAQANGYRIRLWELGFFAVLGTLILLSIRFTGTLLIFAYLVLPPVAALRIANSMRAAFSLSVFFGLLATILGFAGSLKYDLPTTFSIVGAMALVAILASLIGLIARRH
jgi:zinc transport system permease protein